MVLCVPIVHIDNTVDLDLARDHSAAAVLAEYLYLYPCRVSVRIYHPRAIATGPAGLKRKSVTVVRRPIVQ